MHNQNIGEQWPIQNKTQLTVSNIYCDKEFLLTEDIKDQTNDYIKIKCPEIPVTIGNTTLNALIDSGANVNCLSEEWFQNNKSNLGKYEELPATSLHIQTALGGKSRRIQRIVLITAQIFNHPIHLQCLIVPNLIKQLILGVEFMRQHKVTICFENNTMNLQINDNYLSYVFYQEEQLGVLCELTYYCHNNDNTVQCEDKAEQIDMDVVRETISKNNQLDSHQKTKLESLIQEYNHIFSDRPGLCNKYQHRLEVKNTQHFKCHTYPIPLIYQEAISKEIKKMEDLKIIERCNSTFVNPIIPVIKKTGEIRLCLDARKANEIIIPDYECNKSINELLAKGQQSKWLSTIDLTSSYWQVQLTPESRQYTAFQFQGKVYQFIVTPFGISTSQAALVRALDRVFENKIDQFSLIYIDDICVMSPNFDTHLNHLRTLFQCIAEAGMTIKFSKSLFCRDRVPFLGYHLTTSGLEIDHEKVVAITDFPAPKNRKQLKSFLGCINYYNKFLDQFSQTVQPLLRLTSKKVPFKWTDKEEQIFKEIKQLFLNANVLKHPDPNKTYYLQTDASDIAIGGHLYQYDEQGKKAAIIFISRALKPAERHYTTTEKELISVVHCLQKVRYIILGSKLVIQTDNQAITFLKTCKLINARLTRWILALQDFNFTIEHCRGIDNPVADALSRVKYSNATQSVDEPDHDLLVAHFERIPDPALLQKLQDLPKLQQEDTITKIPYNSLRTPTSPQEYEKISKQFLIHGQILYQLHNNKWLVRVPEALIDDLIWECHTYYMHCGTKKCMTLLQESFIFKNMGRRIRTLLASCDTCQHCKIKNHPTNGLAQGIICSGKNEQLAIDVIGPLPTSRGNVKYILIVLDIFTKFVKLYPLRTANTKNILNKMLNLHFPEYGLPKKIQSDNGTQFKSNQWINKMEELGIQLIFNPLYHPKTNMSERPIREVKRCLRTYCHKSHKKWAELVPHINQFLNEIYHETTGFTPNELQFGTRDLRFWNQVITNPFENETPLNTKIEFAKQRIRLKRNKRANKINARTQITTFIEGDLVLIKNHPVSNQIYGETAKLFQIYQGPFKVCRRIGHSTYNVTNLENEKEYGPYHVTALRKYVTPRR